MRVVFDGEVYRWPARTEDWFFVALPAQLSAEIREIPRPRRGFGSVRVSARLGGSSWNTSIFPDAQAGAYVLPLKRAVRDAEGIECGGIVSVALGILDV